MLLLYTRFASPHNQRVTESLIERILQDHLGMFDPKDIKSESFTPPYTSSALSSETT